MQNKTPKTIFIIIDLGIAIRNILRTDVFRVLREQDDIRLVVFSPITDGELRQEVAGSNVIVESVPEWKPNTMVKMARSLKRILWAEKTKVFTYRNRLARKESRFLRWLAAQSFKWSGMNDRVDALIALIERMELKYTPDLEISNFERYKPDLVFFTTLYSKNLSLEIEAWKRKIKTIAFIQSWDNPTSKGPFAVWPDRAIVWNEILRDELVRFHNFPSDRVCISGVPQFDLYVNNEGFRSKTDFFSRWNLDPGRRLLTYTTGSFAMLRNESEVVEQIYQAVTNNALAYPCQLLVRLHPKDKYECYKKFEGMPHLVIQRPGRVGSTRDYWNPSSEDMYDLAELMKYSDVIVNTASTITIDAVCFDTPVVNVAFDGHVEKPYDRSCRRYYDYEHYRNIIRTGGVRIGKSIDELVQHVNIYLNDPSTDKTGRALIRKEQCWKLDGASGRRIAKYVLAYLREEAP